MEQRRPTLLIFTLGAPGETQRRVLLPRPLAAVELAFRRACLDLIVTLGRSCGCQLAVSSPRSLSLPKDVKLCRQRGQSFGARFRAALHRIFSDPESGPVLAVGTDVPGIKSSHVQRALDLLKDNPERVVLGPCPDGGFYLLAASRPLDPALAATSWCQPNTLTTLIHALEKEGRPVALLEPLSDLDSPADLERWLADKSSRDNPLPLLSLIRALLAAHRRPSVPRRLGCCSTPSWRAPRGRAPPLSPDEMPLNVI